LQIDDELRAQATAAHARGEHFDWLRIDHTRGGGGFDDVVVVFTGTKEKPEAKVRIREVKHYPGRYVPKAEFSSIGEGLKENLKTLRQSVEAARDDVEQEARPSGFGRLVTSAELDAIEFALDDHRVQIEIVLGPGTKIGDEHSANASVLADLRTHVRNVEGSDALSTEPTLLDQSWVDVATRERGDAR
jgi:hypothetical protein